MIKVYFCPMDQTIHSTARGAIKCWMNHMPDLFRYYTLAQIARSIGGASRERVRQIANSLDVTIRRQEREASKVVRGKPAERRRRQVSRRWKE